VVASSQNSGDALANALLMSRHHGDVDAPGSQCNCSTVGRARGMDANVLQSLQAPTARASIAAALTHRVGAAS
jgi:hypothetical protein